MLGMCETTLTNVKKKKKKKKKGMQKEKSTQVTENKYNVQIMVIGSISG